MIWTFKIKELTQKNDFSKRIELKRMSVVTLETSGKFDKNTFTIETPHWRYYATVMYFIVDDLTIPFISMTLQTRKGKSYTFKFIYETKAGNSSIYKGLDDERKIERGGRHFTCTINHISPESKHPRLVMQLRSVYDDDFD